jgi:hypothetical protein
MNKESNGSLSELQDMLESLSMYLKDESRNVQFKPSLVTSSKKSLKYLEQTMKSIPFLKTFKELFSNYSENL